MRQNLKETIKHMKISGDNSDYKDVTKFYGGMNFTTHNFKRKMVGGHPELKVDGIEIQIQPSAQPVIDENAQMLTYNPVENSQPVINQQPLPQQQLPPNPIMQQLPPPQIPPPNPIMQPVEHDPVKFNTNAYLPLPNVNVQPYTIKAGTILYCGSLNKDVGEITASQIQTRDGNALSFFTPNFRLAFDRIGGCSIHPDKSYIHAYEAKQDITNIFIKHDFITSMTFDDIQNNICSNSKYNGVGFFYPANEIEHFNAQHGMGTPSRMYAEFFLCNPFSFIAHLNTQKCIGTHRLGVIQ